MYLVSNSDFDYVIKYLGMMIYHTPKHSTQGVNAVRMATLLRRRLEAKQPLPKPVADEIKILSKKCLQDKRPTTEK